MRKYITLLCVLFCTQLFGLERKADQTVPFNYVLMEKFTGTWCVNCPAGVEATERMLEEGNKLAVISYQMETAEDMSMYYNQEAFVRRSFYDNVPSVPRYFFNGATLVRNNGSAQANYDKFKYVYDSLIQLQTPFKLKIAEVRHVADVEKEADTFYIRVEAEKIGTYTGTDLRLHIVLTQDHIQKNWYNKTEINHVERTMRPTAEGFSLDFGMESKVVKEYMITYSSGGKLLAKNVAVLAFIQDHTNIGEEESPALNKSVLQADMWRMEKQEVTLRPDFRLSKNLILLGDSIQYFDNSLGSPTSIQWTFEGGKPSTATGLYPWVVYKEAGKYKTTLEISKAGGKKTIIKENVIEVIDLNAKFEVDHRDIKPKTTVQFTNISTGSPDTIQWFFTGGDPVMSKDPNPQVTYEMEGKYSVRLTIKRPNPNGPTFMSVLNVPDYINVDKAADKEELQSGKMVCFYPNPNKSGIFKWDNPGEPVEIRVFNSGGKELRMAVGRDQLDLSSYGKGLFFIRVKSLLSGKGEVHRLVIP